MLASDVSSHKTMDTSHASPDSDYALYEKNHLLLKQRYKYVRQIQRGSFGMVTLAIDVKTNTHVAMKTMFKAKEVAPMAWNEINILSKLGHDNEHICQLLDHFETKDYIILVLEYCANGDLYDMIHSTSNGPRAVDVWNLAKEIYHGLQYAHNLGIFHRDLKPENILFTDVGRVKICDWGLATYSRYSAHFNVGTEKYMAPECFLNSPVSASPVVDSYDCKYADYWSLGITLLTAVFGTAPFKPVRVNDALGSADDFKRKNKSVKKSLESDSNFKHFVMYNMPEVLYDIYPTMNENCFKIFMNLLKAGGVEDDIESYNKKIRLRSLDKFIEDLENNWKFGLTVWEEEELYENEYNDEKNNLAIGPNHHDSVFDMDDFSGSSHGHAQPEEEHIEVNTVSEHKEERAADTASKQPVNRHHSIPVPSLVESSYQPKSWYDLEDELDDTEFNKFFSTLSCKSVPTVSLQQPSGKAAEAHNDIRIVEKEVFVGGSSWSDYWWDTKL